MTIIKHETWQDNLQFTDVGAIVYYLHAVPWLLPEFRVENHLHTLVSLQHQLEALEELCYEARKFLILA
jgi:hypothetical protein